MHVAGLQLFEVPAAERETYFDGLKDYIARRVHLISFMTRKLQPTPLGIDHPVWVKDEAFDIDRHVRRTALPSPGTRKQLEQLVARLHETPMERDRPLWEFWLIEGLESGHVAWYTKYHHACIDGMAGQAIIDILFSDDADTEAPIGEPAAADDEAPGLGGLLWDATRQALTQPLRTLRQAPAAAGMAWKLAQRALDREMGLGALGQRAPRTRFNVAIGPYRNFAIGSLPLSAVKAVGKRFDCKVNDVFMAVCAGGLRTYLEERGELPKRAMVAGAPVSLRQAGDQSMSNQVTMLLTSLETQRSDPVERLLAIRDSANKGKGVVSELSRVSMSDLSIPGLPLAFRGVMALYDRLRLGDFFPAPVNVVISNVPGPRRTVYLKGARMLTHYPVSIPAHGNALNITVQSYCDRMDFSLTACLDTLPDADRLRDHMLAAWEALQRAAGEDDAVVGALPADPVEDEGAVRAA